MCHHPIAAFAISCSKCAWRQQGTGSGGSPTAKGFSHKTFPYSVEWTLKWCQTATGKVRNVPLNPPVNTGIAPEERKRMLWKQLEDFLDSEQQFQQQFLHFGGAKSCLKKKKVQVKPTGSEWKKVQIHSKCQHNSLWDLPNTTVNFSNWNHQQRLVF